jgi:adenylate cyclase
MTAARWQTLLAELRRRRVVRVALVYGAAAFAVLQLADIVVPALLLPGWTLTFVVVLTALGFPLAIALAWVLDVTADGIRVTPRSAGVGNVTPPPALLGRGTLLVTGALVLAGIAFGAGWVLRPGAPTAAAAGTARLSVAVLPFADLSDDRSQEYFGDGIAEELLNTLRTSDVDVASRSSSFAFKGRNLTAYEIAQQLGVDHIIEGSVRKAGDRLRISAQVIDVRADRQLWSQTFDRSAGDIFSIQDEIARAVANALRVQLAGAGVIATGTRDAEAYDLYLLGLHYWNQRTADGLQRALEVFRAATERDPGFARAWAGLSLTYGTLPGYTQVADEPARREARAAAEHAVRLDPNSAEARTALGGALRGAGDLVAARREFERAIELDPTFATAHHWLGMVHTREGRLDEAEAAVRRSIALDPSSLAARSYLALILEFQRRTEEALAETEALLARAPDYRNGLIQAFVNAATLGLAREHEPRLAAYLRVVGEDPAQARTIVAAVEQDALRAEAVATLHAIERRGLAAGRVARRHDLYVLIGAHEEALRLLEREPVEPMFLHTRTFDPLREDPRFQALLARRMSVRGEQR